VLRAKYFREGSFLDAQMGRRPLFAWRSILKIWGDKWIPNPSSYKVQSPVGALDPDSTISSILGESGNWNIPLIRDSFNEVEAKIICSIVTSPLGQPDKQILLVLCWMYSVGQNHYHVLLLISQECRISSESSNIQSLFL
jgi:hypothetical protein